ncbi:signal peptidase I [Alkaliphilus transvaalensis]|uniref:signal peptidase I n=1 Tax=Alkaliphilus transvaalensis TaxID=114628 RepID=UPI000688249D|nr:signal peptidase I [Alkaliphilus transvaalensis]
MVVNKNITELLNNKVVKEIREWTSAVLVAVVMALLINVFIFELYTVRQTSMWPTFYDGDQVVAWKFGQLFNATPDYGDIVIVDGNVNRTRRLIDEFKDSALISRVTKKEVNDYIWIKRVIGKPGDLLEFKDNSIYRNGEKLEETYVVDEMISSFETIVVPDNHVYVMGDNRENSRDSRSEGPIPIENVRGKVLLRFYPFNRFENYI